MRHALIALAIAISAGCAAPLDQAQSPLSGLAAWRDQTIDRYSSADASGGNKDYVELAPAQTHVLLDDAASGVIEHIWLTIDPGFEVPQGLRKFVLRMFFDGAQTPCVEAPVGDFFGLPHGVRTNVSSLPLVVSAEGRAMNCFFPMPYRHSARITIENAAAGAVLLYYNITVARPHRLGDDVLVFHARYHQEWPPQAKRDYRVLEATGRGQFVGCVLGVQQVMPGWFGEGDERIRVDDAPALLGTGTEDYFLDAWDLREGQSLYYGFPLSTGEETGSLHSLHRFHVEDPIPFKRHFVFDLEHWGRVFDASGKMVGNGERFDRFSSVAYWYQDEPHHDWSSVGSASERVLTSVPLDPRFVDPAVLAGRRLVARGNRGKLELRPGNPAEPRIGEHWRFLPSEPDAAIEIEFAVARDATHGIDALVIVQESGGRYAISVDDQSRAVEIDTFARGPAAMHTAHLGQVRLSAGTHRLTWRCLGQSAFASGAELGLQSIVVREVAGER